MVERLAHLRETTDSRNVFYLADRQIPRLQTALELSTTGPQQASIRLKLAFQQLLSGKTQESLDTLAVLEKQVAASGGAVDAKAATEIRMRKAIAYLRLGEQENCQVNHTAESCLFPIQREGWHRFPRGSRTAIALLTEQLGEFPDDLGSRWLLNLAHMTLGEWPEKVPEKWLIPPGVFAPEHDLPHFPDVAGALGLDVDDLAGGVIVDDFNNDGFLDIMVSAWGLDSPLRLFRNQGTGGFTEITEDAGLTGLVGGLNIQQTDYNNDGWLDAWILRGSWVGKAGRMPNSLLRNNGDGTFTDVTVESGLLSQHPTQASVWFDYDNDGWIDLFVGNESSSATDPDPCELFHNNGNGTFTECAATSGLRINRFVKGVACGDYDRDGRRDLYVACIDGPNLLFRNEGPADPAAGSRGGWRFNEVSKKAGVADDVPSFATWFFDYDNDGWEDLFVCGYKVRGVGDMAADYLGLPHTAAMPRLYHNNGDGTFTNATASTHMNRLCHGMGCNFGDLDNDGWLDMYLGTGDPDLSTIVPNRMFRNDGGTVFQEVTTAGGFGHLQKGHGIAFADLDNDGDQDVYAVMGGAYTGDNYRNALFLNPGATRTNHWLKLKLEGTRSNRAAIGARIELTLATPEGPRRVVKIVNSGASFGSNPLRQELGLGDATAITSAEITWPATGVRQVVKGLGLDQAYRIREGEDSTTVIPLRRTDFDVSKKAPHHPHGPAQL